MADERSLPPREAGEQALALFAAPRIVTEADPSPGEPAGTLRLRSADPLGSYPVTVLHSLRAWADADPDHPLVAERNPDGAWRTCGYGAAAAAAEAIGQALLDRGLGPDRPLLVLSGNSVNHLLVSLGAMTAGVPVAPVSVAYSLQSRDHARIRAITQLIRPGAVFAEEAGRFAVALDTVADTAMLDTAEGAPAIVASGRRPGAEQLSDLLATTPGPAVRAAFAALTPDTVAKLLFTSGSTGTPKGVINTHRMLSANQQMMRQAWPFLTAERPVIVDWLPWSHTFGGNHNMDMVLTSGGTLYVDAGRPAPGLFTQTIANLTDVPPTVYFNVPAGYAQLVPALEADPAFAERFFSRLRLAFNAAAALPAGLRTRLAGLARRTAGRAIPVTGSWGATETGPAVTTAHFDYEDARCIGVPLPGAEVKLVPAEAGTYEIRARGPMVTPGYYGRPDLTADAFDGDGFYRSGDAVAFADAADPAADAADPADPAHSADAAHHPAHSADAAHHPARPAGPPDPDAGLVFRGRIAEDFKLATGTFVRVGALRTALLSAAPVLSDAVLAGENRDYVGALAWLNPAQAARQLGAAPRRAGDLIIDDGLQRLLADALTAHNDDAGSSMRIARLLVMAEPADLDAGEITDKGYVNQRAVLARRAALVEMLYADPVPPGVVVAEMST